MLVQCPTVKSVLHSNITQTGFNILMMKFPLVEIQSALHLYFPFVPKAVVIKGLFFPKMSDSGKSVLPFVIIPGAHTKSSRSSCVMDTIKRPLPVYKY